MKQYLLIIAISLLATVQAQAESVGTVQQHTITGKNAVAAAAVFLGTGTQALKLNLPDIQVNLTPSNAGDHKTGIVYPLPTQVNAAQLFWESVNGGYVARIQLFSNQARRLRFHLVFNRDIASIAFRLKGNIDSEPLKPVDHSFIHDNSIWLPITKGNKAELEVFVDDTTPADAVFSIDAINIIVDDLNSGNASGIKAKSLGYAKEPETDLACFKDNNDYPALEQAASATALMDFVTNGFSYICTGTLLNDKNSSNTPWFATANHCISDDTTANGIEFTWFLQATTCGGNKSDSRLAKSSGIGAQLLWTDANSDAAFLKLNVQPPNGVAFMGWDSDNLKVGEVVWGVHHPEGDHTMVSTGNITNLHSYTLDENWKGHYLNKVLFTIGGTEHGSSGSGLFTIANRSAAWRGALFGGPKGNYQKSSYSDFSSYYPNIKAWLANTPPLLT